LPIRFYPACSYPNRNVRSYPNRNLPAATPTAAPLSTFTPTAPNS